MSWFKPQITQPIASYYMHHTKPASQQLLINKKYTLLDDNIYKSEQTGPPSW